MGELHCKGRAEQGRGGREGRREGRGREEEEGTERRMEDGGTHACLCHTFTCQLLVLYIGQSALRTNCTDVSNYMASLAILTTMAS